MSTLLRMQSQGMYSPSCAWVNDVHSKLNSTRMAEIVQARDVEDLTSVVMKARTKGKSISVCGGRHAMGGQQFATDAILIDTTQLNRVVQFDSANRFLTVEAGILWPDLIHSLRCLQTDAPYQWGIAQKQTGADRLSIGGALSSNIHGRGLKMGPFIRDIESFMLVDAEGRLLECSRVKNQELFKLAIGGYGLFGIIGTVTLRLVPRKKVRRVVELIDLPDLMGCFERRIAEGCLYGDFQFATDERSEEFLNRGVLSCYQPVGWETPVEACPVELTQDDWRALIHAAHIDKAKAFRKYGDFYLKTCGQVYYSDTHQLSLYLDDYHTELDRQLGSRFAASELITELYVPRERLVDFMADSRTVLRETKANLIYGTVRLIERDEESFLAWAKQDYACIVFNLHIDHTADGLKQSARAFRRLIDVALRYDGSYYLTYHKYASREQLETCYPQFPSFLKLKRQYDPEDTFQSNWYRHHRGYGFAA